MGRVASSVDNWMIESLWSTVQRELFDTRIWDSAEQLGAAIFEWIEAWYNPRRRHTSLGMLSPSTTSSNGRPRGFAPPPPERHDHHTTRVRSTGSGSDSTASLRQLVVNTGRPPTARFWATAILLYRAGNAAPILLEGLLHQAPDLTVDHFDPMQHAVNDHGWLSLF
jgi:hypothetical protein